MTGTPIRGTAVSGSGAATLAALATVLLILAAATPATVLAAPPDVGAGGSSTPANAVTSFQGTLQGMRRGIVVVEKEDGSEALVMPPESISSFQFLAKATPAFLSRGMMVRFSGNFGPNGVPTAPISKVTLFQPVDTRSLHGRARQQFTPGVHAPPGKGGRNQPLMGKLTVVGSLMGLTPNGFLAVRAGKTPVRVPVNSETEFEVCYNNLSLAQPGDPVSVSGFYQPPNENQVKAERITIKSDRVYGEYKPEEQTRRRRRGEKKERKKRGAGDGQAEGAKAADDAFEAAGEPAADNAEAAAGGDQENPAAFDFGN